MIPSQEERKKQGREGEEREKERERETQRALVEVAPLNFLGTNFFFSFHRNYR
jgi:hypothetical protein